MHDHLGVAARAEHVAERLQLGDQLLVVVDLAVEDDATRAVLVEQRLLAGREIDDRQPAVAEADAGLDVQAAFIGAAMMLRLVHAATAGAVDLARAACVEDAGDCRTCSVPPWQCARPASARPPQLLLVQALVARDHRVQAEAALGGARRPARPHRGRASRSARRASTMLSAHRVGIGCRQRSRRSCRARPARHCRRHGRDHRHAAGHRFEDGVGDAFGQRRQHEDVEPAQHGRDIAALTGQPGQVGDAGLLEELPARGPERPVADDHEAQRWLQVGSRLERAHERVRQRERVLDRLQRPTVPTIQRRGSLNGQPEMARPPTMAGVKRAVSTPLQTSLTRAAGTCTLSTRYAASSRDSAT